MQAATVVECDREIIDRYTDQPSRLPPRLRAGIEEDFQGRPVQLYAMADLDASLRLAATWVALGPERVALAREEGGTPIRSSAASRAEPSATCDWIRVSPAARSPFSAIRTSPPWRGVRFTHRQRRAMENIQFVIEQQLAGRDVPAQEPDGVYADAVAGPVRDAQALVAPNDMAVIWRLLSYLAPYKGHVAFGMVSATFLTLLVPGASVPGGHHHRRHREAGGGRRDARRHRPATWPGGRWARSRQPTRCGRCAPGCGFADGGAGRVRRPRPAHRALRAPAGALALRSTRARRRAA